MCAMPTLRFTDNLQHLVQAPEMSVAGDSVAAALNQAFAQHPRLRAYIVNEQGALRTHVVVFIDGRTIVDRVKLSDPVNPASELYVMQALSGG